MGLQYRKKAITLRFKEDKPTVYKIQQVVQPPIEFDELIKECSTACGVNKSQTKAVLDALLDRSLLFLSHGHQVKFGDFGSFKPAFRAKTVADIADADASTVKAKIIRFYPGKDLRDMIVNLGVSEASGEAVTE